MISTMSADSASVYGCVGSGVESGVVFVADVDVGVIGVVCVVVVLFGSGVVRGSVGS